MRLTNLPNGVRGSSMTPRYSTLVNWTSLATILVVFSGLGTNLVDNGLSARVLESFYGAIAVIFALVLLSAPRASKILAREKSLLVLVCFYALMILIDLSFRQLFDKDLLEGRLEYLFFLPIFIFFYRSQDRFDRTIRFVGVVTVFSCALNVCEIFLPALTHFSLSETPGRAAGFYENPNVSAYFISSAIPLICWRADRAKRLFFYAISLVGILVTFSRAGIISWFAAVLIAELLLEPKTLQRGGMFYRGVLLVSAGLLVGLLAIFQLDIVQFLVRDVLPPLGPDAQLRLDFSLADDSTAERIDLLRRGYQLFLENPIFGAGFSYTRMWEYGTSVHNVFVMMLADQGLIGFLWLLAFLFCVAGYGLNGLAFVGLFILTGLFNHNLLDGPGYATVLALYLAFDRRWLEGVRVKDKRSGVVPQVHKVKPLGEGAKNNLQVRRRGLSLLRY